MARITGKVRSHSWLLLALGLTLMLSLWLQMPRVLDPYTFQEDFAKFFWMNSYEDPQLFAAHRFQIPTTVTQLELGPLSLNVDTTSPAYSLLFFITSSFSPIMLSHKLLLFPLMVISVYFLFRIGEMIRGPGSGFALALAFAILNLNAPSSISLASGLQRSFVAPVLIVLIYALMKDNFWMAALVTVIGGLFYPPVALLGFITYLLSVLEPTDSRWRFKLNWRKALPLLILLGIGAILLLPAISRQLQRIDLPAIGQADQIGAFLNDPQYLPGGRYPLFLDQSLRVLVGRAGLFERVETFWQTVFLAFMFLGILLQRPRSWFETPPTLKRLLVGSFMAFGLAWLAALVTSSFVLYLPSRYGRVSLGLVFLIFVVTNFETALAAAVSRLARLDNVYRVIAVLAPAISFLAVIYVIGEGSFQFLSSLRFSMLKWPVALSFASLAASAVLKILTPGEVVEGGSLERSGRLRSYWLVGGLGLFLIAAVLYVRPVKHDYETVEQSRQKLLTYLGGLPPDVLVAGGPCLVDDVPMLAKRSVLWNCEQPGGQQIILDTLNAYYADSMVDVLGFCQQYDIDYLVVNQASFELEDIRNGNFLFEPYTSLLRPQILNQTFFVLQDIPEPLQNFKEDGTSVIPCKPSSIHADIAGLNLLWSYLGRERISTNGALEITLGWTNNSDHMTENNFCLEILDSAGQAVQEQCFPLSADDSSSDSQLYQTLYMDRTLRLSPYLAGGPYAIAAEIVPPEGEGDPGDQFTVGEFLLDTTSREFASLEELEGADWQISWGNQIALMDYTIDEPAGETLEIGLRWLALQRMSSSYKVFAHLINPDTGELVNQLDTIPRDWSYPTIWWERNEVVTDSLVLSLSDVDPGQYQLWIGFYDAETLERLPLDQTTTVDNPVYSDAFKLSNIER